MDQHLSLDRRKSIKTKATDLKASPSKSEGRRQTIQNIPQLPVKKKCISKQGLVCIVLQIISLGEYAVLFMSINAMLYNDYKVQFGLQLTFFLLSKVLKIVYYVKIKEFKMLVFIIFCLDYVAVYLTIKKEREKNINIEEGDKDIRKEWVDFQNMQQNKIDKYLESLQPKSPTKEKTDKGNVKGQHDRKLSLNVKKAQQSLARHHKHGSPSQMTPQKTMNTTHANTTEPNRKESNTLSTQGKILLRGNTPQLTDSVRKTPDQEIQFFKANRLSVNMAHLYLQSDNERSQENALNQNQFQQNEQIVDNRSPTKNISQFMHKLEDYERNQPMKQNSNLHTETNDLESQRSPPTNTYRRKQSEFSQSPNKMRSRSYSRKQTEDPQQKKEKKERSLETTVQSKIFKKLNLTEDQLSKLIINKFVTLYVEEEIDKTHETYFLNRKLLMSAMRVYDGILMDAPCLYILTYIMANHVNLIDLYPFMETAYWYIATCLSISICFFNNLQNLPFRQHTNYFSIQLKNFLKNLVISFSIIISTTLLWSFSSVSGIALLIYDCSIFFIIIHQVFAFMKNVYSEEIRGDKWFAFFLFLLCFLFSIVVGCLLLFVNLIFLLNSDLVHESLLQLRKQLTGTEPGVKKDEIFPLLDKSKYGFSFLKRQNMFFILNIIGLALISFFVNKLYSLKWEDGVIYYYKILIAFFAVAIIGIFLQFQDSDFFSDTLSQILLVHFNRITDNLKLLTRKLKKEEIYETHKQKKYNEFKDKMDGLEKKIEDNDTMIKDFEHEEHKLMRNKKTYSSFNNSVKNSSDLKLITIQKKVKEIREQNDGLKADIVEQTPTLEAKKKELEDQQEAVKNAKKELDNFAKQNGVNLKEEIIVVDEEDIKRIHQQLEQSSQIQNQYFQYNHQQQQIVTQPVHQTTMSTHHTQAHQYDQPHHHHYYQQHPNHNLPPLHHHTHYQSQHSHRDHAQRHQNSHHHHTTHLPHSTKNDRPIHDHQHHHNTYVEGNHDHQHYENQHNQQTYAEGHPNYDSHHSQKDDHHRNYDHNHHHNQPYHQAHHNPSNLQHHNRHSTYQQHHSRHQPQQNYFQYNQEDIDNNQYQQRVNQTYHS